MNKLVHDALVSLIVKHKVRQITSYRVNPGERDEMLSDLLTLGHEGYQNISPQELVSDLMILWTNEEGLSPFPPLSRDIHLELLAKGGVRYVRGSYRVADHEIVANLMAGYIAQEELINAHT